MRLSLPLRTLAALGVGAALALGAPNAAAVYQCGPDKDDCKCGMDDPYPCCDNGGNCTWWAWEQACCNWAVGLPGWGNANQWHGNAKLNPNFDVLSTPVPGSIANRVSGSYGHVAWVTAVNGSQITVTEQNCWGGWGHQTSTYNASYFDGGFIVPHADCECQPGATQTESCGNCGERARTCNSSCKWESWGACGGEGECAPGASDEQACGDCGKHARTCQSDCSWGAFGACEGTSSGEGGVECDTGQKGVCAKGVQQCVGGNTQCIPVSTPTTEICDGLDNDCNGAVDDAPDCWQKGTIGSGGGGGGKKPVHDAGSATNAADPPGDVNGSASCSLTAPQQGTSHGAWLLVLAACAGMLVRSCRVRDRSA
jgi:hypothetical protein